jgi:hypothetical protein
MVRVETDMSAQIGHVRFSPDSANITDRGTSHLCQERTKDNAFQTSRLHVQSRTGHSADKGSADSIGQSHQGKA